MCSLLAAKQAGRAQGDGAVGLEDLVQEAVTDLWRGLQRFRYQSRLQTWAFTVTSHCLNRAIREQRTQKRTSMAEAQSLEAMTEALGESLPDQRQATPEEIAQGHELGHLLRQILARHPDRRLGASPSLQAWVEHAPGSAVAVGEAVVSSRIPLPQE